MSRYTLAAAVAVSAVLFAATDAAAFCRTTTCECKHGDKVLDEKDGLPQSTCGQPDGDCPRDEHNCRSTGIPVAWGGKCTGFSVNLGGTTQLAPAEFEAAFDAAFQAWSLVDCGGGKHPSIQVFTLRPTTCAESEYYGDGAPNVNSIYFTDNGWTGARSPLELDAVIAKTKVHFLKTGEILDADMAINSARHDFTVTSDRNNVQYDLVSVITHEVGHFLGLDHSDDPSAVMYWQYGPHSLNRELRADDIAGICTVYPPDRVAACEPTPHGGLQDTCGPAPELGAGCSVPGGESPNTILSLALTIFGVTALRYGSVRAGKRKR